MATHKTQCELSKSKIIEMFKVHLKAYDFIHIAIMVKTISVKKLYFQQDQIKVRKKH